MRFLLDENFPKAAIDFLKIRGHEVFDFRGTADQGMKDDAVILPENRCRQPLRHNCITMNTASACAPSFRGGPNIAMKIPTAEFDATLRFYRDVIRLPQVEAYIPDHVFQFGSSLLWLDCVPTVKRTEVWLELLASDTAVAAEYLMSAEVERCDLVETLPDGFDGFWIRNPASIVHLVTG